MLLVRRKLALIQWTLLATTVTAEAIISKLCVYYVNVTSSMRWIIIH